jgi:hypothetical protein
MSERLRTSYPERERTKEKPDLFERLAQLEAFVGNNPDSPALPMLAEKIREILGEEKPAPILEAAEEEPALIEEPEAPAAPPEEELSVPDRGTAEPEREPKVAITFEEARKVVKPVPNELVAGALTGNLRKPGGPSELIVKSYLDNVPADAADKKFATDSADAIRFREELSNFVASELKVHATDDIKGYIETRKKAFFNRLEAGKRAFKKYVAGREARMDLNQNPVPRTDIDFYGFTVDVGGGNSIDLLESSVKNARANIYIQREIMGGFVHWSSQQYVERKISGDRPKMTHRIYLNPKPQESVKVFRDVVHAIEASGLAAKAKIYDRTFDSGPMKAYDSNEDKFSVRGDGIVIYGTDDEAEALLKLVERQYDTHEAAFEGRGLSSVPLEIAPGFGIGDEPKKAGSSLTSHRADVIETVLGKVRGSGIDDLYAQQMLFQRVWRIEAQKEGINPDNLAFNL